MKNGWSIKRIGEVCDLATGGTPSRKKPEYFGGKIKWLVSGDIHQGEIYECNGRITELGVKNSNAKMLTPNSVLIALNGQGKTKGTVAILRTEATCNQSLVAIYPKPGVDLLPEFIYLNLQGRYEEIRRLTSDGDNDRKGLNMSIIKNIKIPLAPLPAQEKIIENIKQAFLKISIAKEISEKRIELLDKLKRSVLQEAYSFRS